MNQPPTKIDQNLGAIILSGGQSRRMGLDKWKLPLGPQTLLDRIVQTLSQRAAHLVVSIGSKQKIQIDKPEVCVVVDEQDDCGPLEGIRAGLAALESQAQYAFVVACDVPFFNATVIDGLLARLEQHEAVIPSCQQRIFALTAIYRTEIHPKIEKLMIAGQRRASVLADQLDSVLVDADELKRMDADLNCLQNINHPDDYFKMLDSLGIPCDPLIKKQLRSDNIG